MAQLKNTTIDGYIEIKGTNDEGKALILPKGSTIYVGDKEFEGGGGGGAIEAENPHFTGTLTLGDNAEAFTEGSIAMGVNVFAGAKGYYIVAIENIDNIYTKIYLSEEQVKSNPPLDRRKAEYQNNPIEAALMTTNINYPIPGNDIYITCPDNHYLYCGITYDYDPSDACIIVQNFHLIDDNGGAESYILSFSDLVSKWKDKDILASSWTGTYQDLIDSGLIGPRDYMVTICQQPDWGIAPSTEAGFSVGSENNAVGDYSFVEGKENTSGGPYAHIEGRKNKAGYAAHAEGNTNFSRGRYSHTEGQNNTVSGHSAHAEGLSNTVTGKGSHAEGEGNEVTGLRAHAEGYNNDSFAHACHTEGQGNVNNGNSSHAEGYGNTITTTSKWSHIEGKGNTINAESGHIEGQENTISSGSLAAHAEGFKNQITGNAKYAHIEGQENQAAGQNAHAEGYKTYSGGSGSHVEGLYTWSQTNYQHVQGKYNVKDTAGTYAHIVGGGTGNADSQRKNIHTLDWYGNAEYAGNMVIKGNLTVDGQINGTTGGGGGDVDWESVYAQNINIESASQIGITAQDNLTIRSGAFEVRDEDTNGSIIQASKEEVRLGTHLVIGNYSIYEDANGYLTFEYMG